MTTKVPIKSCQQCSAYPSLIVLHTSAALRGGLRDRISLIAHMGNLAGSFCARLVVPRPCELLEDRHASNHKLPSCKYTWERYLEAPTFVDGSLMMVDDRAFLSSDPIVLQRILHLPSANDGRFAVVGEYDEALRLLRQNQSFLWNMSDSAHYFFWWQDALDRHIQRSWARANGSDSMFAGVAPPILGRISYQSATRCSYVQHRSHLRFAPEVVAAAFRFTESQILGSFQSSGNGAVGQTRGNSSLQPFLLAVHIRKAEQHLASRCPNNVTLIAQVVEHHLQQLSRQQQRIAIVIFTDIKSSSYLAPLSALLTRIVVEDARSVRSRSSALGRIQESLPSTLTRTHLTLHWGDRELMQALCSMKVPDCTDNYLLFAAAEAWMASANTTIEFHWSHAPACFSITNQRPV
mmetsp:Transcript_30351/g.58567  ORF Transcript_30351/g.58567 Transcript_30351/m.58567 type:complete len:407 (-) Transcript_30351:100-1320(-)